MEFAKNMPSVIKIKVQALMADWGLITERHMVSVSATVYREYSYIILLVYLC